MSIKDISMEDILQLAVDEGASDIHIGVGIPPCLRIHGHLTALETESLTPEDCERFMREITPQDQITQIKHGGGADYGLSFKDLARFRVNAYLKQGSYGVALRQIPSDVMSLDGIGLPPQIRDMLFKPRGLILVTGPTGSGKTTTLASMIDLINRERDCHILTIEDPIEYVHKHKRSIVSQRELGHDVDSFAHALRAGLRQDPDVILVGEMRDLETMRAAITAAETGHLVMATLHTTGAARTVDRIVDAFPPDQQPAIRVQLASSLVAVISQALLKRTDKPGRVAAFEVMISTPSIQTLIRDCKTFRITSDIQTGARFGMVDMDTSLMKLYQQQMISYEDMLAFAQNTESITERFAKRS